MKLDSSQEDMKAGSSTRMQTNLEPVNSKDQTMDSASDCNFVYSTPQVGNTGSDIQGSVSMTVRSSYSIDSGISDTFNSVGTSSLNDVSSLSAECSPQSEPGSKRLALKACDCSPIKRVSSTCIQGRRLTFTEADFRAVKLSALEINASERETSEFCDKSVKYEEVGEHTVKHADGSPVLESEGVIYESYLSSPDSALGESLEVSIQEMALQEFWPGIGCTPIIWGNGEQLCHEGKCARHRTFPKDWPCSHHMTEYCKDKSVKTTSITQSSQTETPFLWANRQPKSSNCSHREALHHRTDAHLKFHNKLLAPASAQNHPNLEIAGAEQCAADLVGSEHSTAVSQLLPDLRISSDRQPIQTCANFRVASPAFQQYTQPWSLADPPGCLASTGTSNYDSHKGLTSNHSQSFNPSKRSSDCTQACCFPFGPPKVRRTHTLINEERAVIQIPRTCASGKAFDIKDSVVSDCDMLNVDNFHLYNSSLYYANQRPKKDNSTSDIRLENPDTIWCHSFYGKNNQAIEPEAAVVNVSNGDCVNRCLQKLQKLCPVESGHLIGSNVGIGKFDIVCELYQQNFQLCLEAIFSHLADSDLASLVTVSTSWKLAVCSEHKAYHRYRQHKRSLSVRSLQHVSGKENTGEKPSNAPSSQTLTQSRGLLSSIQSQAETKTAVESLPATVAPRDVLMCDDTLRACPHCQGPAMIKPCQDRATCLSNKCAYDFCTLCFTTFHHPRPCKPLCKAPSRAEVAGTKKSKKNLKRL